MSLVEQKKLQWAKEREEMSKLSGMFSSTTRKVERTSIRTYYSNVDLSSSRTKYFVDETDDHEHERTEQYFASDYYNRLSHPSRIDSIASVRHQYSNERVRSPSLPPINRNKDRAPHGNTDEDTSGYLSDGRTSPNAWKSQSERSRPRMRLPNENHTNKPLDIPHEMYADRQFGMDKTMGNGDGSHRSRRTTPLVGSNKYFERGNIDGMRHETVRQSRLKPDTNRNGQGRKMASNDSVDDNEHETDFSSIPKTPSSVSSDGSRDYSHVSSAYQSLNFRKDKEERAKWADRNLPSGQLYENAVKTGPCWLERGFIDSGDESVRSYSFIRGQNAPIDANELAERTNKRVKALEFQNAIKEQLKERETIKRLEHERILLEERRQEDRVRKQMEMEKLRAEDEQRKQQDKMESEMRKQIAMKVAIEKARQEAELEKARRRRELHLNLETSVDASNEEEPRETSVRPTCDDIPKSNDVVYAPPREPSHDDGEKFLIGTPIKMRKKAIPKSPQPQNLTTEREPSPVAATATATTPSNAKQMTKDEPRTTDQTDADGIALILQTLPPIVPILAKNDLINLNQNISNLNNIQLAVMLAHQMQQLNTTMAQLPTAYAKPPPDDNGQLVNEVLVGDNEKKVRCNICGKRQKLKSNENASTDVDVAQERPSVAGKKDMATSTETISDTDKAMDERRIGIGTATDIETTTPDDSLSMTAADCVASQNDASTQTDDKSIHECCFQCRHHQCHQHHHHTLLDKMTNEERGDETKSTGNNSTKSTAIDAKSIELRELKESQRLEDRPKWGVNRPQMQYVKASERDPNYVRNRKRGHKKRAMRMNQDDGDGDGGTDNASDIRNLFTAISRANSPTPSTITNGTVTLATSPKHDTQLKEIKVLSSATSSSSTSTASKRNICTEILPIKTDMNGRVYLNFREASVVMSEDEIRQNLKNRYNKMKRIINRGRSTTTCHTSDSSSTNNDSDTSRKSHKHIRCDGGIESV